MRPDPEMLPVLIDTAKALKGSQKRLFMARAVKAMGRGGQRWAEVHLGWSRVTIGVVARRCRVIAKPISPRLLRGLRPDPLGYRHPLGGS